MKVSPFLLLLVSFTFLLNAQTVHRPVLAVGASAYSIHASDVFSFTTNPAALAKFNNACAGIYGEKKLGLNELNFYQAAVTLPTHSGNFGIKTTYFGFVNYNETELGIAYARKIGNYFDMGLQFDFDKISIGTYGETSFVNYAFGIIFHLNEKFQIAANAYNPVAINKEKKDETKFASIYKVALGYEPSKKFVIAVELEKEKQELPFAKLGLQYHFMPQLLARGGIETNNAVVYFGMGYFFKFFRLDVIASHHPQLGISPGVFFFYDFKKKQK